MTVRGMIPVILSGGSGTRLWPLSRDGSPKQLLALGLGQRSLLQEAALRAPAGEGVGGVLVVANAEHRFLIAEQLRAAGVSGARIVLEPVGRNTAAAVAVAAELLAREDPDALLLVMPADHVVTDVTAFREAVTRGRVAAEQGALVLFGIEPRSPATGYGYIRMGEALAGAAGARRVSAFVEKPDLETAQAYLASGSYLWNSGMFLLPAQELLAEYERLAPEVLAAARAAVAGASRDLDFLRLDAAAFADAPSLPVDVAIMERTDRAAVVPADFGWGDVGSWSALRDLGTADEAGNVVVGDGVAMDSRNCYLHSEGALVAALGVEDLVVVATRDAVLVTRDAADQSVRALVARLREAGHGSVAEAPVVHRPWGTYQGVDRGARFQVKRLTVYPGGRLSLQRHRHRAEHWVVVRGTARVTIDGRELLLGENESAYIPAGAKHRLENPATAGPLEIIEVQTGGYLGEDDIERFEDVYGRA